jgi:hypothetical protein
MFKSAYRKSAGRVRMTGLIAGTIIAVTAALLTAVTASAAAPAVHQAHPARATANGLPSVVMWDLASDFGITATNPQPDSYGDPGVWSFLQGAKLFQPATFTLLGTHTTKQFGVAGLDSWQGSSFSQPNDYLPQVSINASGAIADGATARELVGIFWPKNVILVHPAPAADAIVGWTSPVDKTVTVTATVAKLDQACGHGITWRVSDGAVDLAGGTISRGGKPQGMVRTLPVSVGTTLYLEVGPNHDFACDSTGVTFTVTGS